MQEVFGWRAAIGEIHPSRGQLLNMEFNRAAPPGVVFHSASMLGPLGWSPEGIRVMLDQIEQATKMVVVAGVDTVIQVGLPVSILNGIGTDKQIIEVMEKASGLPCTTQITAIIQALRHLDIAKILIVTGYFKEQVNQIFYNFMTDSGFEVLSGVDLGIEWSEASDTSPYAFYRPSKSLYKNFPQAEGILIAGGNTLTNDVIESLETDLGVPVITQSSASLWQVLNIVGVKQPIPGLGKLLEKF